MKNKKLGITLKIRSFTLINWKFSIRILILIISAFFFIFQIFYYLTQPFKKLDTVPVGIETILLFIYIFLFFYQFLKNSLIDYVYNNPAFWIAVGILVYLGGSFFFYILTNHIPQEQIDNYTFLANIAEIIKNILFAVALIMYLRQPDENTKKVKMPNLDFV